MPGPAVEPRRVPFGGVVPVSPGGDWVRTVRHVDLHAVYRDRPLRPARELTAYGFSAFWYQRIVVITVSP